MKPKILAISLLVVGLFVGGGMIGIWTRNVSSVTGDADDDGLGDTIEQTTDRVVFSGSWSGSSGSSYVPPTQVIYFYTTKCAFDYTSDGIPQTSNKPSAKLYVDSTLQSSTIMNPGTSGSKVLTYSNSNPYYRVPHNVQCRIDIPSVSNPDFTVSLDVTNFKISGTTLYIYNDTDKDGYFDGDEVNVLGTDPLTSSSWPTRNMIQAIPLRAGQLAMISWYTATPQIGVVKYNWWEVRDAYPCNYHTILIGKGTSADPSLYRGGTIHYRIGKVSGSTVIMGSDHYFSARNGEKSWDGTRYTFNLLITFDGAAEGYEMAAWTQYLQKFATDFYNALNSKMQIGTVILTDCYSTACNKYTSYADILIKTSGSNRYGFPTSVIGGIYDQTIPSNHVEVGIDGMRTPDHTGVSRDFQWNTGEGNVLEYDNGVYKGPAQPGHRLVHELGHYGLYIQNDGLTDDWPHEVSIMKPGIWHQIDGGGPWTYHYYKEFSSAGYHKTGTGPTEWKLIKYGQDGIAGGLDSPPFYKFDHYVNINEPTSPQSDTSGNYGAAYKVVGFDY